MGQVDGKIALMTGAAMGIGAACAVRLAEEGATIILTDIDDKKGESTAALINSNGGRAEYLHQDVTQEDQWIALVNDIGARHGGLDILVNNAGIAVVCESITEMSLEDFHLQNSINLDGVFLGLKHCIPVMSGSGGGSIINLSSVAGLKAAPSLAAYAMTKGGVKLLSKSVAKECAVAGNGVRVNSVHPGIIDTAIWNKMGLGADVPGENRTETSEIAQQAVPGGKLGVPTDIANGVVFLASESSSYMTGSELVIDHGLSC
jgi:NAD(P)-dependent dehydrogenase (short-subunit alcohol dehydrogenase family)